jgi:fructan beta-fructosidase
LRSNRVGGEILEIIAEIDPGSAVEVGLKVRKGPNEETVIGVDTIQTQLFVDRTRSGNGAFDQKFPGRHVAPTHLGQGKSVRLRVFVDQSSVEVFGNDDETVISDCIFPARSSQAIEVYSSGGEARILKLDVWKLRSAWQ